MNIQQLLEGQNEQIANLSPNTLVKLFYATNIEDAAGIILAHNHEEYYPVYPTLRHASRQGDVVIQFHGLGRYLEAPSSLENPRMAQQKYQHSSKPEVSAKMLSVSPMVYYNKPIFRDDIDNMFVMQDGRPEEMSISEFMKYAIQSKADQRRMAQRQQRRQWA